MSACSVNKVVKDDSGRLLGRAKVSRDRLKDLLTHLYKIFSRFFDLLLTQSERFQWNTSTFGNNIQAQEFTVY